MMWNNQPQGPSHCGEHERNKGLYSPYTLTWKKQPRYSQNYVLIGLFSPLQKADFVNQMF